MNTERVAAALRELAAAIEDHTDGAGAVAPPPVTAPAAAFATAAPPPPVPAGNCPVHNIPWRTTKRDGSPAKRAYCSEKVGDAFCEEKGPWLTLR